MTMLWILKLAKPCFAESNQKPVYFAGFVISLGWGLRGRVKRKETVLVLVVAEQQQRRKTVGSWTPSGEYVTANVCVRQFVYKTFRPSKVLNLVKGTKDVS